MAHTGTILITTINGPTQAVKKIARLRPDWRFIVIGDTKTPKGWEWPGVTYLSVGDQIDAVGEFAEKCPTKHYARKNVGYLKAIADQSRVIAETDDDNIPYDSFLQDVKRQISAKPVLKTGWENVYTHFTRERIWPRGFPLELVNDSLRNPSCLGIPDSFDCPIQQFLADGDPDVDAVYRLTSDTFTTFDKNAIVLKPGTYCPFNSQNTLFWPEAYPLLYLPAYVSFRMTDIWRSFVAQRCLYAMGKPLAFLEATVLQERNEHSLARDFKDELPGYIHNPKIIEILDSLPLSSDPSDCAQNLGTCYETLVIAGIVPARELELLKLWIDSVTQVRAFDEDSRISPAEECELVWGGLSVPAKPELFSL